jgi:hypothetical protein
MALRNRLRYTTVIRKRIAISVVLLIVCYLLYTRAERVQRGSETFEVVTRIDAGSNRTITILAGTEPFEIPAYYYEIDEGSQKIVRTCFLRCCLGNSFRLVTSRDRSVVGLAWNGEPDVLLFAYDFNAPHGYRTPGDELSCERAIEGAPTARDKLQAENPQLHLRLP